MMGISVATERSTERSIVCCLFLSFEDIFTFGFVLYLLPAHAGRLFIWMDLIPFWFGGSVSLVTKRGMKSHRHDG